MKPSASNDEKMFQRTFTHLMELFFEPEIRRRQQLGLIAKPFNLLAAQVIFRPDGTSPEIRLNEEVQAKARMKLRSGVEKTAGEPIFAHELEDIVEVRLTDSDDPDCSHVTLLLLNNKWILSFDFRQNKALANKHISVALQFLHCANYSLSRREWVAFVDNLFSAAELAARATLLLTPDPRFRKKATHKSIQIRYQNYVLLGNADSEFKEALNKLSGLRERGRYVRDDLELEETDAKRLLHVVTRMINDARARVA